MHAWNLQEFISILTDNGLQERLLYAIYYDESSEVRVGLALQNSDPNMNQPGKLDQ